MAHDHAPPSASWSATQFPPSQYPRYREVIRAADGSPAPAVRGRNEDVLLRPGLLILIRDLLIIEDVQSLREVGPAVHLGLMLDGGGYSALKGAAHHFPFPSDKVTLLATTKPVSAEFFVPAATAIRYIDIRFEHAFLADLLRDAAIPNGDGVLDDPELEAEGIKMNLMPMSPAVRRVAEQIIAAPARTACDRLFLEGKVLEALSVVMSEEEQRLAESTRPSQISLSTRDRQRLHEARDLLIADLERTWLLRDLARQVGLNENKLKYGFRQIFGNSVYSYLQHERMNTAAQMLARGEESITNIALAVGYANPAHFSKIFRRYFGVSPSHYARHGR